MKKSCFLLLVIIYALSTFAKDKPAKPPKIESSHLSFTLETGMNQFDGDMNQAYNSVVPNANFKYSLGASLEYTITPVWGIGLEYFYLPLSASHGVDDFTSNLHHLNPYIAINFLNLLSGRIDTRWGLWMTLGGGLGYYNSKYYVDKVLDGELKNGLSITVPVGLMIEYNYSKSLAFGAKLQYRSHNKDNLEGNPDYNYKGVTNDFVSLGTVLVRWKFNAKKRSHVRNVNAKTYSPEEAMIPARQAKAKADSLQSKVDSLRSEVDVMKPKIMKIESILAIGIPEQRPVVVDKKHVIDESMVNKNGDDDRDGVENFRDREPNTASNKAVDYWGVTIRGVNIHGFGSVFFGFDKVDLEQRLLKLF